MMTQFHFQYITGEFVTMHPMSELSGRDKCALFNRLLDDLGIRERLIEDGHQQDAIFIISEQLTKAWDTPRPGNMEKAVEAFNTLTPAQQKRLTEDQA